MANKLDFDSISPSDKKV